MSKKKDKKVNIVKSMDYSIDIIKYIFVMLFMTLYLLVFHNKYFDITKTRSSCFEIISISFACIMLFMAIICGIVCNNDDIPVNFNEITKYSVVRYATLAFLASNVIAFFIGLKSEELLPDGSKTTYTLYGTAGRFLGFLAYVLFIVIILIMMKRFKGYDSLYLILASTIIFTLVLGFFQHAGVDAFGLKIGIAKKQYNKFISTLGNNNVYASYLIFVFAISLGIYMYSKNSKSKLKLALKLIYAVIMILFGMSCIISNSDSIYLGIMATSFIAFIIAYRHDELTSLFEGLILFAIGNLITCIWHTKMAKVPNYGGISHKLDKVKIAVALLIMLLIMYGIIWLIYLIKKKTNKSLNKNIGTGIILGLTLLGGILIICVGVAKKLDIFTFNYKWGTYRGYIWIKSWDAFKASSFKEIIFGHGQESIRRVVSDPNEKEMYEVTKRVYDNCHNEVLQYLLTIGVFGLLSYLTMIISGIVYIIKHSERTIHCYVPVFVVVGYFAQSLVNINQPITTPLFFVIFAIGLGYATNCRLEKNTRQE